MKILCVMVIPMMLDNIYQNEPTRTNIKNEINDWNFKSIYLTI